MAVETELLPVEDIVARLKALNPNGIPKIRWNAENKDRVLVNVKRWQKEHPDKVREYRKPKDSRRRARLRNSIGSFTATEWLELLETYHTRCAHCGKRSKKLTVDHIIPLIKGGTNYIDNIVPACGKCNFSKRDALWDIQRPLPIMG